VIAKICLSKYRLNWTSPILFIEAEISRIPKGIAGIYVLQHFSARWGGYPIFYVGKSQDLRRRLLQHVHLRSAKPRITAARYLGVVYFSAAPVPLGVLAAVESGIIRLLKPICNDAIPQVAPLLVNLPPQINL
jgi:hypothetical protein